MAEAWPADVPETLWTYHSLALKSVPQVPMMGVTFATGFLVATAAGALFLLVFARDRFMNQRRQADAGSYLVLTRLEARDLGGGNALRKAYLIYATVLLVIYFSLTFFGNLIFGLTNKLPVAGIEVDVSKIRFDQPTWPLAVAFGLAGLAPLLRPAQIAEDWLRERAYRAVGIPTRIQKTTRKIIAGLDAACAPSSAEAAPRPAGRLSVAEKARREKVGVKRKALRDTLTARREALERQIAGTWIEAGLGRTDRRGEFLSLHAQVEMLVLWARGARGAWPGIEVADSVLDLERGVLEEAEKLLNGFNQRLGEARIEAATAVQPAEDPEKRAIRAQRRSEYLADTLKDMRRLRADLAAVVAVFVERDPVAIDNGEPEIRDEALDGLLLASEPSPVAAGPEISLGLAILCFMPVYAALVWKGLHPAFAEAAESSAPAAILATIGLEALRQTLILWLPVMTAFSVRQYLIDDDRWIFRLRGDGIEYLRQRAAALTIALIVAFLGLVVLAALWAFLQAISEPRYKSLLFGGSLPYLLFYPTMFFIAGPMVWSALAGADARARGAWGWSVLFGLAGAALVFAAQSWHVGQWYGWNPCVLGRVFLLDIGGEGCFKSYGGLDFVVYPLLAFLTAVFFGNPEQRSRRQSRLASQRSHGHGGAAATVARAAIAVVGVALLLAWAGAARAASDGAPPASVAGETCDAPSLRIAAGASVSSGCTAPTPVKLGFRADAEPFSFRRKGQSGGWEYAGYVADLCHEIFSGPQFAVTEIRVEADDRFKMLEKGEIQVLCDPVTLRFSDTKRVGLYSPIIFASGVSYLRLVQRAPDARAQIGFVEGTTAEQIARRACEADLFMIVSPRDRGHLPVICETNWTASQLTRWQHLDTSKRRPDDGTELARAFRAAASLQRRWAKADLEAYRSEQNEPICGDEVGKDACHATWDAILNCADDPPAACTGALRGLETAAVDDKVADIVRRMAAWGWLETIGGTGDCSDEACVESMAEALKAVKYDQTCDPLDNDRPGPGGSVYRFCPMESHDYAIRWLCSPRLGSASNLVYMGDRDIIVGKLQTWTRHNGACPVENAQGADNLTYEPYALLFRNDPLLAATVQRGVYDFFSRRTHAIEAFKAYFPDKTMSVPLSYLFLLNAVEEEETATTRPDVIPRLVPKVRDTP